MLLFTSIKENLTEESPIVVMSRGHSGTRVLSWALDKLGVQMGATDSSPPADARDVTFTNAIKRIVARNIYAPVTAPPKEKDLKLFKRAVSHYMNWLSNREPAWGWKFPETYMIGNYVEATFPKAKYIHLLRDGRDIAFKRHNTDQVDKLGYHILKQTGGLRQPHHVQAAMSWAFQLKRFREFENTLAPGRVLSLKFEELCAKPHEVITEVCRFLGLSMNEECEKYLKTIDAKKIAQYKNEDGAKIGEIQKTIGSALIEAGYLT